MAKLLQHYQKTKKIYLNGKSQLQYQDLDVIGDIKEYGDWSYNDFEAHLYINGEYVAEISGLLSDMGVFKELINQTDWDEKLAESKEQVEALQD